MVTVLDCAKLLHDSGSAVASGFATAFAVVALVAAAESESIKNVAQMKSCDGNSLLLPPDNVLNARHSLYFLLYYYAFKLASH